MSDFNGINEEVQKYVNDVLSGEEVAGEAIRLACKRFKSWFDREEFWFDNDKVNKVIDFIAHLKHFEDEYNGQPFLLLPWQKWIIANIFGWYRAEDHNKRVIRNVFLLISRKNGKTALSAAIMLAAMIVDGVAGAECYLMANSRDQAKICYKFIDGFSKSLDPKRKHLRTFRDYLIYPKTNSKIKCLSSDTMTQDGLNPSCFILDEFHASQNSDNYNVLKSGQASRKNPLAIIISSAGVLLDSYPCYEECKVGYEILRGLKEDDSRFYAIYQLDKDDDWRDESVWKKASPNYGITVREDYMKERILEAKNDTAKEADVKTKNLNMWVQSMNAWLPNELIDSHMQKVDMSQFTEEDMVYMGIDLSAVRDLTSTCIMFPPDSRRSYYPDKFIFKSAVYIPPVALRESPNRTKYENFLHNGYAKLTSGKSVDYDAILADIMQTEKHITIQKISYDAWQAAMFVKNAMAEGLPMEPFAQGLGNFNRPTKTFEILLRNDKVIIDTNLATKWCFNNCELKIDHMENCKPVKAGDDQNKKIDIVIAMLEALGGYLLDNDYYYGE